MSLNSSSQFQPIGRWQIQISGGDTMLLNLNTDGTFQATQQNIYGFKVQAIGQWGFNPYNQMLQLQGLVNGYQPFMLGIIIQRQQNNEYYGAGSDGYSYIITRAYESSDQVSKEKTKLETTDKEFVYKSQEWEKELKKEFKNILQDLGSTGGLDPEIMRQLSDVASWDMKDKTFAEKLKTLSKDLGLSNKPLNKIEDYYHEGSEKFNLRWPLNHTLPFVAPFDELDRRSQFFVLFAEWQRREMEGMTTSNKGQLDQAEKIFQECLQRAEQIEVRELIARSYEGLMRVANKRGDRKLELQWSKKSMETRV